MAVQINRSENVITQSENVLEISVLNQVTDCEFERRKNWNEGYWRKRITNAYLTFLLLSLTFPVFQFIVSSRNAILNPPAAWWTTLPVKPDIVHVPLVENGNCIVRPSFTSCLMSSFGFRVTSHLWTHFFFSIKNLMKIFLEVQKFEIVILRIITERKHRKVISKLN